MIRKIFVVLDTAANAFGSLWCVAHVGEAVRAFTDQVNRPDDQNLIYKHPQDFALYELGEYDDTTGVITPQSPTLIVQAAAVKNQVH